MDIHDKIIDLRFPKCPIRNVIARIGDRWSILLLLTLDSAEGPMRFKELQQAAPDISQKMLTRTLRDLEADGYVTRKAYAEALKAAYPDLPGDADALAAALYKTDAQ